MKHLTAKLLLVSIFLFALVPMAGPFWLPADAGMGFLMVTLYIVNPLYFIVLGVLTVRDVKANWYQPLLALALFIGLTRLVYGVFEPTLIMMNIAACALAVFTAYIGRYMIKATRRTRR